MLPGLVYLYILVKGAFAGSYIKALRLKDKMELVKMATMPTRGEIILHNNNHYTIGEKIGQGNFGVVYDCIDSWGNNLVAKVLLPKKPYEEVKTGWQTEFQNLLTLRNPFITYFYDAFEFRDTFYIITEKCLDSLSGLIKIPDYDGLVWARPIARCLLQAINFMHSVGYVHKDVHLGNVFTSIVKDELVPNNNNAWTFKLGDLGISKLAGDINVFNTILAKWMLPPEYLNPDEFGIIDQRIDIYHTGLLLMQVLTGAVQDFSERDIVDGLPRKTAEQLPPPYNFAISKALRRHVDQRTRTALEFWNDLNQNS